MPQYRFGCDKCDYYTDKKSSYDTHLLSNRHIYDKKPEPKQDEYKCSTCDYITKIKSNYTKHLKTNRHLKLTDDKLTKTELKISSLPKYYKFRQYMSDYKDEAREYFKKNAKDKDIINNWSKLFKSGDIDRHTNVIFIKTIRNFINHIDDNKIKIKNKK